jgi:hypothetical protein
VNNSPGLSSVRMTRTTRSVKERRKRTTNKVISLNSPLRGKEQRHGGAYTAGGSYIAKGGRRLALLPRRFQQQGCPFTPPRAGGRCGRRRWRQRSASRPLASQLEAEDEVVADVEAMAEGECPPTPGEDGITARPRMMSTG